MMIHPHDPTLASAAVVAGSISGETRTIDSDYRLLVIRGLSPVEAGNVVAYMSGLHAVEGGWTVEEVKHLVAIRLLVAGGVIAS
jgi:hypothetical protein